jgi:Beta-ketoacyl synthase, N-terminal domain
MMSVFAEGAGVMGPGLEGWPAARPVLSRAARYEPRPVRLLPPALLPAAERRRAGTTARLAIATGTEALAQAGRDPAGMAMVFAASGGDGETVDHILRVLSTPQREVSPTRFHNSVHNAAAGYWSVATGSRAPSTSLSACDDSFAAGMLEAVVQATVQDRPITLIACDVPYPEPLNTARPIVAAFGMALVLAPRRTERTLASLTLAISDATAPASVMADPELERLRLGNPAARALPLLAAIARSEACTIRVGGIDIAVAAP